MQVETKALVFVVATIMLIVASSFAGLGYLANRAIAAKAGPALAAAPDVHLVQQRASILLAAAIAFWLAASAVFAQVNPRVPGRKLRPYIRSAILSGVAIVVTVTILEVTARLLQLV